MVFIIFPNVALFWFFSMVDYGHLGLDGFGLSAEFVVS